MSCCHCEATEMHFGEAHAEENLRRYRQGGPDKTTRLLLDGLRDQNLEGTTLLDVGCGIGVITHELLAHGVTGATLVDAASAYLRAAEAEAERRGHRERVTFVHGDFARLAGQLDEADLVTLDRVVCCYPDLEPLVATSAAKARRWYALSYPPDRWYVRLGNAFENWCRRRRANDFRTYIHPEQRIHALLLAAGFDRHFYRGTLTWRAAIYIRSGTI